ncbi:MAG: DUF501 domain-containing protein [Varibaculum sp.]|nr:DUF501 domain-containing protein [Varibaculum sp.]
MTDSAANNPAEITIETPLPADLQTLAEQLGRQPRGVLGIAARHPDGAPAVVATAPQLPDGEPFPTFLYLTHPDLVLQASRMEAAHDMQRYNEMLVADEALAAAYREAHRTYLAQRERAAIGNQISVPDAIADVSAGGMPSRVKCLHALLAHSLAAGEGVNPIGDMVRARIEW